MGSLSAESRRTWGSTPNIREIKESDRVPLSFNQEQELSIGHLPPDHPVHLVSCALKIDGPLDLKTLEKCIQETVDASDALRTSFTGVIGMTKPIQLVEPQVVVNINVVNLSKNPPDDQNLLHTLSEDAQRPIDISGTLLRVSVFKIKNNSSALLFTTHRAICDESSIRLFLRNIFSLYEAAIYNQSASIPTAETKYSEFANWQQKQFSPGTLEKKFEEWKKYMDGASTVVQLPTDFPLPPTPSYKGSRHYIAFDANKLQRLRSVAQEQDSSISNILLATFGTLIQRYTGQTDFAIGTRMNSRLLPGLEKLIGCFSNTVIIRADTSDNPKFTQLIEQVKKSLKTVEEFMEIPLEKMLRESSSSQEPNVMFTFEDDYLLNPLNGIRFSRVNLEVNAAKYELHLSLAQSADGIVGYVEYNPDLFLPESIDRMIGHYETLLDNILKSPFKEISKYHLLTKKELLQFKKWNDKFGSFDRNLCVHHMVEEQVAKTPHEIAVFYEREEITYEQINQRANQLANYLIELGVKQEKLVAICVERTPNILVTSLAVLKAGGGFVFVDPNFPKDRISYMLEDTQAPVIITENSVKNTLPSTKNVTVINMNEKNIFENRPTTNPKVDVKPTNLSYVQYTSGSTGRPKGVMVEHRHFVTNLLTGASFYKDPALKYQLAATTSSFVPGILELYFPVVCGQHMVISKNAFVLPNIPHAEKVNYVGAVPSIMVELVRMNALPHSVHTVAMFGEPVTKQLVQQLFEQCKVQQILIHYGCTEAGTCVITPVEKDYRRNPPIGRPLEGSQFHVLDNEMQLVPVGIPGELYIVTAGLSRGYLGRDDLTSERFLPNPYKDGLFMTEEERDKDLEWVCSEDEKLWLQRAYRTGDLCRYRPDGCVDVLGRIDHQVKIRGIRVELGEIENAIHRYPGLREVVVTAFQPPVGDKKLVAYLVFAKGKNATTQELRTFSQEVLPQHMIPSVFIVLDKFPQTPNGKIDRKQLPVPEVSHNYSSANAIAARNEVEKKMCTLWEQVLQIKNVGVDDNFYEVGGNSMRAIQLMLKVSEAFKVNLPAKCLFENPTIEGLCGVVQSALDGQLMTAEAFDPEEEAVLDEDIYPARAHLNVETLWNPKDFFLTGATGFLGAYLLSELLQQTKAHAHCLVRAKTVKEGAQRLQKNLENYGLWNASFTHRISAILGDLEKPLLGLTRTQFFQLGQRTDVIYHCGAPVNFVKPYSNLKPGSVLGTQEILRLACLFKVKPVHYVSSVVVLASVTKKVIHEMDDLNSSNSFFHMGYTRAKWVAEMLVWIAKSRGLPVTILRPGYVVGHSRTGATNTNDYFSRLIRGCIEVGFYPDMNDMMWLIPVDYVTRAIVHVTRMSQSIGKAFHLAPLPGTDVTTVQLLDLVREFGYPIQPVSSARWVDELEKQVRDFDNALLPLLPYIAAKYRDDYKEQSKRTADYDSTNTLAALEGSVITCPKVDLNLINTLINYYIKIDYIKPPKK